MLDSRAWLDDMKEWIRVDSTMALNSFHGQCKAHDQWEEASPNDAFRELKTSGSRTNAPKKYEGVFVRNMR